MATPTQPLRDEHKELLPHIETLLRVADSVGMAPQETIMQGVDQAYDFLAHHLIPHAEAEEKALYPMVGKVLGAPEATATMSRDHVEVGRLTEQLAALRSQLALEPLNAFRANELRRILYGLYALVKVHFAKEEEVYLPNTGCAPDRRRDTSDVRSYGEGRKPGEDKSAYGLAHQRSKLKTLPSPWIIYYTLTHIHGVVHRPLRE